MTSVPGTLIKGNLYFLAVAISLPLILLTWRSSRRGKKRHTFIFIFTSLWEPTRKMINNKVTKYLLCVNTGSYSGGGLRWGVADLLLTGLPYRSYGPVGKNGLTQRNRSNSRRWSGRGAQVCRDGLGVASQHSHHPK